MFTGFSQETIDFMWGLQLNNNKPWFEENKEVFKNALHEPMKALAADVFAAIDAEFAGRELRTKVSRIYKDARRVKDGQPYRSNLWFSIERPSEDEWTAVPVFWFELKPENWSYGLGYYAAKAATMAKFRARLDNHPAQFEKIAIPLQNQTEFVLDADEYKRAKVPAWPQFASWYNSKSFSLMHTQDNGVEIYDAGFAARIASGFKLLMPLYDYLITLDQDVDPR